MHTTVHCTPLFTRRHMNFEIISDHNHNILYENHSKQQIVVSKQYRRHNFQRNSNNTRETEMAYKMNEQNNDDATTAVPNNSSSSKTAQLPLSLQSTPSATNTKASKSASGVNLMTLACATVASTIAASVPIRDIAMREHADILMGTRVKNDGTLVTDADAAAQLIIFSALRNVSADIRIVGEEDEQDKSAACDASISASDEHVYTGQEPVFLEGRSSSEKENDDSLNKTVACEKSNNIDDATKSVQQQQQPSLFGISEEVYVKVSEEMRRHMNIMHSMDENTNPTSESSRPYLSKWFLHENVDPSRISVFVDPLDGTGQYAKGRHECVSTLVGITLDDVPVFGVICKPFGQAGYHVEDDCFTIYGGTLMNGVFVYGGEKIEDRPCSISKTPRAVISSSRSGGIVKQCVDALHDEGSLGTKDPVLVSGAGEKSLRLLIGQEGEALWPFPRPGTSLWDVAAADALLSAIGGKLTDRLGQRIDYSETRIGSENDTGVVAASSIALHDACIKAYHLIEPPCSSMITASTALATIGDTKHCQ